MKILITAGPTREYIDPVRFISNPSTGKIGYLLAEIAKSKGFEVVLISGPTYLEKPQDVQVIQVETAIEMKDEVLKIFPEVDCLIMSAAVSDWKPYKKFSTKIKKKKEWNLKLVPNPDILKAVAKIKKTNQKVIGFALETKNIKANALKKLKGKKLDLIVANTPNFFGKGKSSTVVFLFKDDRVKEFSSITKEKTAEKIISLLGSAKE